ncbi:phospholipase A2, putative [Plasmodium ovale wallikeri]|uniref:Phospholipase A2, putative n=1 Tax=Plasmodium ovale wallikeri TaxID=864142 RepID=A0A1A8YL46_PLAOA|nr:phospholipase A2, putative [Plasmodium ovale wallikeri]
MICPVHPSPMYRSPRLFAMCTHLLCTALLDYLPCAPISYSKWDSIYFGLSKIQVELHYKLRVRNDMDGELYERRSNTESDDNEHFENLTNSDREEENNKNEHVDDSKSNINDEVNKICKFNLEQTEKSLLEETGDSPKRSCSKFKARDTTYYNNSTVRDKYGSTVFHDENNNTETFTCTFNNEDQIRVPSKKKKYIYIYNKSKNTLLDITEAVRKKKQNNRHVREACQKSELKCGSTSSLKEKAQKGGVIKKKKKKKKKKKNERCNHYSEMPPLDASRTDFLSLFFFFFFSSLRVSILSLDGGGVLAMSSLIVLSRIESEIRKEIGSDDVKLIDCFDMICGTSAGGLITLMLLQEIGIQEIRVIFTDTMKKIFEGGRNLISGIFFEGYDVNIVKDIFMEHFGNNFLVSYKNVYGFVTATDVKHNPYKICLLRNYMHKYNAINGESYEGINKVPLWLAAWSTASAPTYLKGPSSEDFKKLGFNIKPEIHLVDGALKASNPSLIALEECARLNNKNLLHFIKEDLDTLVSIGTGKSPTKLTQSGTNSKSASTFEILINSTHLLTRANDTHREVLQWLSDCENTYFRFNAPNIGDIEIDSQDIRDFDLISKATRDYLYDEKYYEIKRLAQKLANNYIRSSSSVSTSPSTSPSTSVSRPASSVNARATPYLPFYSAIPTVINFAH